MISPSTIIILVLFYLGYQYIYKPYILNAPKPGESSRPSGAEPKVKNQPQKEEEMGEYIDYEEVKD